jgi:hypothetical protein
MQTMEHPIAGPFKMPGWPVRFGGRTPDLHDATPKPDGIFGKDRMSFETIGFGSLQCCETMECSSVIRRPKTAA